MSEFIEQDDGSVIYELLAPFEHGGKEISTITIQKLTIKAIRALDNGKGEVGKTLSFLSALTGLTPSALDKIEGKDAVALFMHANNLLGKSLETGEMY